MDTQKAKEELERVMQAINSDKINLEKLQKEISDKEEALKNIESKQNEIEEKINSIKGDIFVYKNECDEIRAEKQKEAILLENIIKERARAEMELFNWDVKIKLEKADLEQKRKNAVEEVEVYRQEGEKIIETTKKRIIPIEESIKSLETKRNELTLTIRDNTDKLACILDKTEKVNKALPELEAKLKEVENQIKTRVKNSEAEMKRCAEIGFEKEKGEKELKELNLTLDMKKNEINEAKEQLLRIMDREKKVEETARRVKALYKRAGIEITI